MKFKFGITGKLTTLFFFLIFIFYGTFLILFIDVKSLMETSEQIINTNNRIEAVSKTMLDNLISMDVNIRKFRLLKRRTYLEYFLGSKDEFKKGLQNILELNTTTHPVSDHWFKLKESFEPAILTADRTKKWVDEELVNSWIKSISDGRKENQENIRKALIKINNLGRTIFAKSLIGLFVSLLAGLTGALFVSKSMVKPIKKLKQGLDNISSDSSFKTIEINSKDEFGDLAKAFNNMSRQLEEDERIRSDFIAMLSHEIRTPMSSIRESVNMMTEKVLGPVNKAQEKFLKIAGSEIKRLNDLLDHLLDVSKLEAGKGFIKTEPIDPNQLLSDVSDSLISKEQIKNVKIRLHELKDAPVIYGVKKELVQVILNLIHNAVKFSPENSFIDIHLNYKDDGALIFQISDQGPGIPEDEHNLIFKKYYRTKDARDHQDGTGLGLSISKWIINGHGGEIFVKNNTDKGCSFFFTLPIKKSKE